MTATFKQLQEAAAQSSYEVRAALSAAEENANDTIHKEHARTPADFDWLALESIAYTAAFYESRKVREWFKAHGYQW